MKFLIPTLTLLTSVSASHGELKDMPADFLHVGSSHSLSQFYTASNDFLSRASRLVKSEMSRNVAPQSSTSSLFWGSSKSADSRGNEIPKKSLFDIDSYQHLLAATAPIVNVPTPESDDQDEEYSAPSESLGGSETPEPEEPKGIKNEFSKEELKKLQTHYLTVKELLPKTFTWKSPPSGGSMVTKNLNQHIPQYCGACW